MIPTNIRAATHIFYHGMLDMAHWAAGHIRPREHDQTRLRLEATLELMHYHNWLYPSRSPH